MIFASWNVRGLNKRSHKKEVINFIQQNKVSLIGLVETKVKSMNFQKITRRINKHWQWRNNISHHYNGRIIIGWDMNIWDVTICDVSAQHITCKVKFLDNDTKFLVTFVYAYNEGCDRIPLWNYISTLNYTEPWCLLGDFNSILSRNDSSDENHTWTSYNQNFKDCVSSAFLDDINYVGEKFTWYNNNPLNPVFKKLDRMLGNAGWFTTFHEAQGHFFSRGIMDHCPMLLSVPVKTEKVRKCFQFFNYMLDWEGFKDMVAEVWNSPLYGNPISILCRRLQLVKQQIKNTHLKHGNLHQNVEDARSELYNIQQELRTDPLNSSNLLKEVTVVSKVNYSMEEEEKFLMQKSRVQWLKKRDGNNSYFFNQIKANWNNNKIKSLKNADGVFMQGHDNISKIAVDYFKNSLGGPQCPKQVDLSDIHTNKVSSSQASLLINPVTNDLIFRTLKSMKKNKAPGPDGFTVDFFLHCWDILGTDFCSAIHDFFNTGQMLKGFNSTLISLIPKHKNSSSMQDYRPISLCTVVYKCITKILATRMKQILPHLIDISQSAFIKGRLISDNILLAQELFRGYNRKNEKSRCALKIDLHKAFDSVNWDFILAVLEHMNFPQPFIKWIKACICHPWFSVKVNGASKGFFAGTKGIRQGDPLSPCLFTLVMNILSCILKKTPGFFNYHCKCKELQLNHLLFADDVLLFSHGDENSIDHLMHNMSFFGNLSGLTPSLSKSTVYMSNCDAQLKAWFDSKYGITHGTLPVKFLGVPLIPSQLSVGECGPLVEKITSRIESWTNYALSAMGRIQLIKSVLCAIIGFWLKHFFLPAGVHKNLQRCLSNFLWQGGTHKISWATACLPTEEGGLGFIDLVQWNKALILFQACRIISKNNSIYST